MATHLLPIHTKAVCASLLALVISTASGAYTARDVDHAQHRTDAAIKLIESIDGAYRAVIAVDPNARKQAWSLDRQRKAPGPLFGEPILIKDNIESMGLPTTAGSLALADNNTGRDAPLVAQLRGGDAVILGKTNLSEWANFRSEFASSGWSAVGGQTRNALDQTRTPCGSSSGSAVAVALGYVDVAIGTETSGSIVCPAAMNGVVGFKPTHGLVSIEGIVPLAATQDTAGPIAKNVELASRTLAVIADPNLEQTPSIARGLLSLNEVSELGGLRIGVFANTQGYDERRDASLQKILDLLSSAGVTIIPDLRIQAYDGYWPDSYAVLLYEFRRDLNAYLSGLPNALNSLTLEKLIHFNEANRDLEQKHFDQSIFIKAHQLPDTEAIYREKRASTQKAMREDGLDRLFDEYELDALIGITTGPAWKIDWVNGDSSFGPGMAGQAAVAGNPHITLPLGRVADLPLGISLIGERWQDHRLAAIAALVEAAAKP